MPPAKAGGFSYVQSVRKEKTDAILHRFLYPQADSNRCCGNENPESWATRRWGRANQIYKIPSRFKGSGRNLFEKFGLDHGGAEVRLGAESFLAFGIDGVELATVLEDAVASHDKLCL